jgi:predicted MFS family arabinose efflux permease
VTAAPRPLGLALGGLVALAAGMGIGRFVYTPILPLMAEDLGMSKSLAGLLASANFLGYLGGALLAATPLVAGSRRRWFMSALAVSGLTTAAMGVAPCSAAFLVLRFAGGVASAFVLVFASALVLDRLAAAGRSDLAAVHFAGVGSGIAVSAVLVSSLVASGTGWRGLWLASGIAALAGLGIVARLVPDRREPVAAAPPAGGGDRGLPALVVAYGLFGFGYIITATFLVAIVRAAPDMRAVEPWVWLVVGLTAAPSVALWTRIAARIGIARAFALACVLQAAGVAASVLWLATAGVLLAAALLGGTFMGLTALGLIGARRLARGDPRRTLAVITASFGLGQIVGPTFAGVVHDATGSFVGPSLTAVAALVVAAVLVVSSSGQTARTRRDAGPLTSRASDPRDRSGGRTMPAHRPQDGDRPFGEG